MDTKKINSGKVRMIAHRGVSGIERENTVPAFVAAGNRSYYGIETDVRLTKDGKFVLHHDDNGERVSNGKLSYVVSESTLDQLRGIVLPDKDGSFIRQDIRIPTLSEYVAVCKKYGKTGILEIKGGYSEEVLAKMVDEIKALDYLEGIVFISFWEENLKILRKYTSGRMQFLARDLSDEILDMCKEYRFDIDDVYKCLTKAWVEKFHAEGLEVNAWTVDSEEEAQALIDMGVDYITTNILE